MQYAAYELTASRCAFAAVLIASCLCQIRPLKEPETADVQAACMHEFSATTASTEDEED